MRFTFIIFYKGFKQTIIAKTKSEAIMRLSKAFETEIKNEEITDDNINISTFLPPCTCIKCERMLNKSED